MNKEMEQIDILIVGGGAAGMACAIFTAEALQAQPGISEERPRPRIVLLESTGKAGMKILVSGGSRCNVTHDKIVPNKDFNGPKNPVRNILRSFNEKETVKWMKGIGVELKLEASGKLFPVTDSSSTVRQALVNRLRDLAVVLKQHRRVTEIEKNDQGFHVSGEWGEIQCRYLVMATGGRSLPKSGSDGHGWKMLEGMGHTVTATYPALVPMKIKPGFFNEAVSGISHQVTLTVTHGKKKAWQREGSMLWTHFGVSGPVIMDASRHWIIARAEGLNPEMQINFLGMTFDQADAWLVEQSERFAKSSMDKVLSRKIPRAVAGRLLERIGIMPETLLGQLKKVDRRVLVHDLVGLVLPLEAGRGWNYAEVTAGGVPLAEVDHKTMGSKLVPDLYLIGELLDVEGRIGGFNFQWAWATAHVAAQSLAVQNETQRLAAGGEG